MKLLFNQSVDTQKAAIDSTLSTLLTITEKIGHEELQETVRGIKSRINDPYMFVIVGEVKAGKSSFINALLETDKEICKVAPSPMTDTIQQIVYGETETTVEITPHLKRITHPVEILKEVAIVDTPGTNTIVDYHQDITESFIPASDLIVFVFESKNPYRESAWKFFEYIKEEWRKKIIFVLQQKDLMEPDDLRVNIEGVRQHAQSKGIETPIIFAVSAKDELNHKKELSGFIGVRAYINKHITGGKAPYLKLLNNAQASLTINDKIYKGLDLRKLQFDKDNKFREDIVETLSTQDAKTKKQIQLLVENVIAKYDNITNKYEKELDEGFGFTTMIKRSFRSMFKNEKSVKQWLSDIYSDLEKELNTKLKDKVNEGVIDIADNIQDMAKLVDAKLKTSETVLKDSHEIYADIAERRANVLKELQQAFHDFMNKTENFYSEDMNKEGNNVIPNIAAGSSAAVFGIIITAVTNGALLDVTGGILTAVGLAFAGVSLGINKRKVLRQFKEEIDRGRDQIRTEVAEKLDDYTTKIKSKIDSNFFKFDQMLEEESRTIQFLEDKHIEVRQQIDVITNELQNSLNQIA